jgi:hypothetical protein
MDKIHKIVSRNTMPDGTKIQIEDWKEVYPDIEKTVMIAVYPIAKNDSYWIRKGESFRLQISRSFSSDKEVECIYQGLIDGVIKLEDLSEHYYNGDKDKFYMGMEA